MVLLGPLFLGVVLRCPSLFCVVLPSFPSFGVELRSSSLLLGPAWSPASLGGGAFPISLGAAFLSLLWVGLRSPSLLLGGAAWSPASLGGGAFPISLGAAFLPLLWVGLRSPSLLLGGAAWSTGVVLRFFFVCVVLQKNEK